MADNADEVDKPDESQEDEAPSKQEFASDDSSTGFDARDLIGRVINVRMLRRLVQILFLLGINAYVFSAWFGQDQIVQFWSSFHEILPTLPIIAPLEAPFAMIAGSFDVMQKVFTNGAFPFFTIGAMILVLIVIGRTPCGWICPIGTIQDFVTLPNRTKIQPSQGSEKELRQIKAYIFVIVMFLVAWVGISRIQGNEENLVRVLGPFAKAAFDPLNPAYILFVVFPEQTWPTGFDDFWLLLTWEPVFWLQVVFIGIILAISYWFPRWFCRWLCPAGWLYGVFSRDALIGIGRNPARCTPDTCTVCEDVCPMNIRIRSFPYQHMHSPDCIMCLECKSHCPNDAIQIRFL